MDKLLIVDGSNLLFQMFYGMPARITGKDDRAIHGTLGFIGALRRVLRMIVPTHAVVLFDGECENPRTALDGRYKANRPDYSRMSPEETPFSQLPDIYAALDHMGIRHRETQTCETDDWIAGYVLTCPRDLEIVILSYDSDFFQLIRDNVTILRYRGEKTYLCDTAYLWEKLGITPQQYAAFKTLTGDTTDNIPGVPKVGPKTAAALLQQFGDLDTMLANTDQIRKPSVRASVEACPQRIRTNYQLIRLEARVPCPFPLEALTYTDRGLTTGAILAAIGLR